MLEHAYFMRISRRMRNLGGGRLLGTTFRVPGRKQHHLVPGSKSTVSSRNFTFSMHVDI